MSESIVQKKTFAFALGVIRLYVRLREQREYVLSKQLLRSGTSIGANVAEALAGQSRNDFLSKMAIASKGARETKYWLQLLQESQLVDLDFTRELAEVEEIILMLTSVVKTTSEKRR